MLSKKRKVDIEGRIFNDNWKDHFFFCEVNSKPVCLICSQQVAVAKEYNIKRHYVTPHGEKYDKYAVRLRMQKVNKLEAALKKQQSVFTKSRETHDGAVKANKIAAALKPYSEGEFIKACMLTAAELVCPEKRQAFGNISLSRNTVAERIGDLAGDLNSQLKDKVKSFIAFSVAVDESTDMTDVAQLGIFICGVDASLTVTEEFVEMVPMTNTTMANDVFSSLVKALDRVGVDWSHAVSMATDGAPSVVRKKAGVVVKLGETVQTGNPEQEFRNFHCIIHQEALCSRTLKMDNVMDVVIKTVNFIRAKGLSHQQFDILLSESNIGHGLPYHTEVRWLSRGVVLKRFFQLHAEIGLFMNEKGKPVTELDDPDRLHDLPFLGDIIEHLNMLNVNMQGRSKLVTEYYNSIRGFQIKLGCGRCNYPGATQLISPLCSLCVSLMGIMTIWTGTMTKYHG
ncbi:E3 SUMO-protein ligase NSE2 isoform X1 [Mobula birostris]|uniref:E3 SUMO-protein ligase NSE2 isoform X1 n=1 Tax=Mobula birostris TaxID=1983395 RepID=UPI003B28B787